MKSIRNKTLALIALFTVSFATSALATTEPTGVDLKHIGSVKNQPVFQLTVNQPEETEYTVAVLDQNNIVLYRDVVKSGVSGKKFLLNTDDLGDANIRFEITGKKSNKTVVYEINRNSYMVSDLVVNKLK